MIDTATASAAASNEYALDRRAWRRARDRAAADWEGAAVLADAVAARMRERLALMKLPAGACIDVGAATGAGTAALAAALPGRLIVAVEPSLAMLDRARVRL
nr:hypothetical protein [Burkholderiales bacterium]